MGIICILPHSCFRINHFLHFYCVNVLYQAYAVESMNVTEGGANTTLGHQPAFWDHSSFYDWKRFSSFLILLPF